MSLHRVRSLDRYSRKRFYALDAAGEGVKHSEGLGVHRRAERSEECDQGSRRRIFGKIQANRYVVDCWCTREFVACKC